MILEHLSLANYRGFDQLELPLCKDITVIAGVNGSGKSSILKALRQACSGFEQEVLALNTAIVGLANTDVQIGKSMLSIGLSASALGDVVSVQLGRTLIDETDQPGIQKRITDLRNELRFTEKKSNDAISKEVEIEYLEGLLGGHDDSQAIHAPGYLSPEFVDDPFPVFAYYSTQRAFVDLPKRLSSAKPLSKEAAHDNALAGGRVSLNAFANWFRVSIAGELGDSTASERLWKALQGAISEILPDFCEMRLETPDGKLPFFSVEKCGTRFSLNELSDGEKALLALVMDITQRLALANPESDNPTTDGSGIILIDEVELHLHPTWQRQVLRRLRKAFPRCQFIVTTHSPQVIGQTRPECLRLLRFDGGRIVLEPEVSQAKGMDSSWILRNIMGCPPRDYETDQKLSSIYDKIDEGDLTGARGVANSLEEELGNFPDLQEVSSLLDRLEMLAEDETNN